MIFIQYTSYFRISLVVYDTYMICTRYKILKYFIFVSVTMDNRSNHLLQYLNVQLYPILNAIFLQVKIFIIETIIVLNKVSQVVLFIFKKKRILHVNTIMHAYKIGYYCYCLCIEGHKFHYFVNLINRLQEQQGKSSGFFLLNIFFVRF